MIQVPDGIRYLSNAEIAYRVESLLRSYSVDFLMEPAAVPVEHILDDYLYEREKLGFDIVDFSAEERSMDVVGLYDIGGHKIYVDKWLYESTDQRERRMYYFTLAHEIGHDQLHGKVLRKQANQLDLFESNDSFVFRTLKRTIEKPLGGSPDFLERQANFYAAALLMPEGAVREQFARLGYKEPIA